MTSLPEALAPSPADRRPGRRLAFVVAAAAMLAACSTPPAHTAVLLDLSLAPAVDVVPDELLVSVNQDGQPLLEEQRLPKAGALVPDALPHLGSVALDLGDVAGPVIIDVYGVVAGKKALEGTMQVMVPAGAETKATLALNLMPTDPPPLSAPDRACQSDADCGSIGVCTQGICAARAATGASCSEANACASGFCVDGVCCDGACTGACQRCGGGTCTAIVNAVAPGTCASGRMCDARGECLHVNGKSCRAGAECASGFCADGVCCNSACDAPCQACGTGTCTVKTSGDDAECGGGKSCDARGLCR